MPGSHSGNPLTITHFGRKILAVFLTQAGLVVPHIDVTGPAAHEQINHPLGGCFVVHTIGGRRQAKKIGTEQAGHRRGAQTQGGTAKKLTAVNLKSGIEKKVVMVHRL